MTELRQRMIEDMRLRGLAEGAQQACVEAVKHLAAHDVLHAALGCGSCSV